VGNRRTALLGTYMGVRSDRGDSKSVQVHDKLGQTYRYPPTAIRRIVLTPSHSCNVRTFLTLSGISACHHGIEPEIDSGIGWTAKDPFHGKLVDQ
jgi:hypothetical protein